MSTMPFGLPVLSSNVFQRPAIPGSAATAGSAASASANNQNILIVSRPPKSADLAAHKHGQLDRLFVIKPRIERGGVGALQVALLQAARAARALGDVFARQFDMDAAQAGAVLRVDVEGLIELAQNIVEMAGLDPVGGRARVSVHRIAHP